MAFVNPDVVGGAELLVRQATSSITSSIVAGTSAPPTSTVAPGASIAAVSSSASPSATGGGGSGGSSGGAQNSSPLLFFVALGFGVVFTNLWIIVGVKYCFRYNARNRALRTTDDGEPITMENMPRPHRRRREKKLMTMDEVNEKFPMVKYKAWVSSRAQEGLPTLGGVSAPASRANSLHDAEGVIPELASKERDSIEERPETSVTINAVANVAAPASPESRDDLKESTSATALPQSMSSADVPPSPSTDEVVPLPSLAAETTRDEDDEDDEHINAALPPECMGTSGDTCAICIDTLEEDDDVRGLTCGHAFHAVCLDPWLTSRRACCPLCKADYYTPKPRPPPAEPGDGTMPAVAVSLPPTDAANPRMNLPSRPHPTFLNLRMSDRRAAQSNRQSPAVSAESAPDSASGGPVSGGFMSRLRQRGNTAAPSQTQNAATHQQRQQQQPSSGVFANLRSGLAGLGSSRRANGQSQSDQPVASGANAEVTPSNLEAGIRPQNNNNNNNNNQ